METLVALNIATTILGFIVVGITLGRKIGQMEGRIDGLNNNINHYKEMAEKQAQVLGQERRDCEGRQTKRLEGVEERVWKVEQRGSPEG